MPRTEVGEDHVIGTNDVPQKGHFAWFGRCRFEDGDVTVGRAIQQRKRNPHLAVEAPRCAKNAPLSSCARLFNRVLDEPDGDQTAQLCGRQPGRAQIDTFDGALPNVAPGPQCLVPSLQQEVECAAQVRGHGIFCCFRLPT